MDQIIARGILKIAEDQQTEVAPPEENEKETIVTCMSSCTYAQNPEKRCMLEGISLSMDEGSGTFMCGQYSQMQQMQPMGQAPQPGMGTQGSQQAGPEPKAEKPVPKKQPGLPGAPIQ